MEQMLIAVALMCQVHPANALSHPEFLMKIQRKCQMQHLQCIYPDGLMGKVEDRKNWLKCLEKSNSPKEQE
jgi:hypothetical protein